MSDVQFCVRLKKCDSIPTKWNDTSVCVELSLTKKVWKTPATMVNNGVADWSDTEYPKFSFSKSGTFFALIHLFSF